LHDLGDGIVASGCHNGMKVVGQYGISEQEGAIIANELERVKEKLGICRVSEKRGTIPRGCCRRS
jgi:hypothetical protein